MGGPPSAQPNLTRPSPEDLPSSQQEEMPSTASHMDQPDQFLNKLPPPTRMMRRSGTLSELTGVPSLVIPASSGESRRLSISLTQPPQKEVTVHASIEQQQSPWEKLRDSVQPYAMQLQSRFGKAAQILRSSSVREMQELSIEIPYEGQLLSFSHEPFCVVSWPHALFKMSPLKEPSPMSLLSFEGNRVVAVENLKRSKAVMSHVVHNVIKTGVLSGSCAVYKYPLIQPSQEDSEAYMPNEKQLEVLDEMMMSLVHHDVMLLRDSNDAVLVHALLVANTTASLNLYMRMVEARPELLALAYTKGPFQGENALHNLAVNSCQSHIIRLIKLAAEKLSKQQIYELFTSHANGSFFSSIGEPTCYFGETPLAFMASFGLKDALRTFCGDERLNWCSDQNQNECMLTGFLPIHAVVACGSKSMFDFLISKELPPHQRADTKSITKPSTYTLPLLQLPLNPLQLAVKLGNHKMVLHVIRRQCCEVQWSWGPTTRYTLNLEGIDSASSVGRSGGKDVMELVTQHGATAKTREMLLDSFMDGLLYKLFLSKWRRFAGKVHCFLLLLDGLLLCLQLFMAFQMKLRPDDTDRLYTPAISLGMMLLMVVLRVLVGRMWWQCNGHASKSWRTKVNELRKWLASMNLFRKIATYLISASAMMYILHKRNDVHDSTGGGDEPIWALIGCANFFHTTFFVRDLFLPFRRMGTFALTVERLVADVWVWFVFNGVFAMAFWASLYILYPRAGEKELPQAPMFNSPLESLKAMWDVGFHVNKFVISYDDIEDLSPMEMLNWFLFAIFYYLAMILIVVLLVRMLMAMLTARFNRIQQKAVLQWRLQFARRVLFAELAWQACCRHTQTWAAPMNPVSGKYEVYLVEQFKAAVGESVKLLFTRELPPEEQAREDMKHLTAKIGAVEKQLLKEVREAKEELKEARMHRAQDCRFRESVLQTLAAIQTKVGIDPSRPTPCTEEVFEAEWEAEQPRAGSNRLTSGSEPERRPELARGACTASSGLGKWSALVGCKESAQLSRAGSPELGSALDEQSIELEMFRRQSSLSSELDASHCESGRESPASSVGSVVQQL